MTTSSSSRQRSRRLAAAGFLAGCAGLAGQFISFQPVFREMGMGLVGSFFGYLAYFTVLSNAMVVAVYWSHLSSRRGWMSRFFSHHSVSTAVAAYIALVAIVYTTTLRGHIKMTVAMQVSDALVHYVAPALFVVWWWLSPARHELSYTDIPRWLIWPVSYLGFVILFGHVTARYIYPILDPGLLGWPAVCVNATALIALTGALSTTLVFINNRLGSRQRCEPAQD